MACSMSSDDMTMDSILLQDLPVLLVDCQTTGASPASSHLLEIGWLLASARQSGLSPAKVQTRLVALPEGEILHPRIKKITGITDEDMLSALAQDVVRDEIQADCAMAGLGAPGAKRYAVAHYAQFESVFVERMFYRNGANDDNCNTAFDYFCTCLIAKRLYPDLPSRAIRALGGYFGLNMPEMKRAREHVAVTHHIWCRLVDDLSAAGIKDVAGLRQYMATPLPRRQVSKGVKDKSTDYLLAVERLTRLSLPMVPGIYKMMGAQGGILYVGKATSLKSRVNSYFTGRKGKASKTKELICQIYDIQTIEVASSLEAALLEHELIAEHQPPYNRALKQYDRTIEFVDASFSQTMAFQSEQFPIGPLPGKSLSYVTDLLKAAAAGTGDTFILWDMVEQEQLDRCLVQYHQELIDLLGAANVADVRRVIAFYMGVTRREINNEKAAWREAVRLSLESLEIDETDETEELEETEITDPQVIGMLHGIVLRFCRQLVMARRLSTLLECRGVFLDPGGLSIKKLKQTLPRALSVSRGNIKVQELGQSLDSKNIQRGLSLQYGPRAYLAWADIKETIQTYDRMRVLHTELGRIEKLAIKAFGLTAQTRLRLAGKISDAVVGT